MSRATLLGIIGVSGFNDAGNIFLSRGGTNQPSFSAVNAGAGVSRLDFDISGPLTRIATNRNTGVVTVSAIPGLSDIPSADWTTGANITTEWNTNQAHLSSIIYSNRNISVSSFTITTFGSFPGSSRIVGGTLAPNGKIYSGPYSGTLTYVIDPIAETVFTIGTTNFSGATEGNVLAPNGNIYLIPHTSTLYYKIDPSNNSIRIISTITVPTNGGAHFGGCVMSNGRILLVPRTDSKTFFQILDPSTDTLVTTLGMGVSPLACHGAIQAPNGKVYMTPLSSNYGQPFPGLIFDPTNNTFTSYGSFPGNYGYVDHGILHPNGKIYFAPYNSSMIQYVDPSSNVVRSIGTFPLNGALFAGGTVAPNGKIFFVPHSATYGLILDPDNDTFTTYGNNTIFPGNAAYQGAIAYPNSNKIIFFPSTATKIVVLNFLTNNNFNTNYGTSPINNRGY